MFEVVQLEGELRLLAEHPPEPDERPHDLQVHLHRPLAPQHPRKHRNSLLRKGIGEIPAAAVT
jgi:hypothetical protein